MSEEDDRYWLDTGRSKYKFAPKEDITVYELAVILRDLNVFNPVWITPKSWLKDADVARHFELLKDAE